MTGPFEPLFEMLDPPSQAPEFSLVFVDFLGLLLIDSPHSPKSFADDDFSCDKSPYCCQ
jgi:hypothetical protein